MPDLDALLSEAEAAVWEAIGAALQTPSDDLSVPEYRKQVIAALKMTGVSETFAALRSVQVPEEWEYGVRWGDDGTYRACATRDQAEAKCAVSFGDSVVRRRPRRVIEAGDWEPAPSTGTTTEEAGR